MRGRAAGGLLKIQNARMPTRGQSRLEQKNSQPITRPPDMPPAGGGFIHSCWIGAWLMTAMLNRRPVAVIVRSG